jgi:hypothetical protein
MPDSEPIEFESRDAALEGRRIEILRWADDLTESYGVDAPIVALYDAAAESEDDFVELPESDSPHDLGVVFEISPLGL